MKHHFAAQTGVDEICLDMRSDNSLSLAQLSRLSSNDLELNGNGKVLYMLDAVIYGAAQISSVHVSMQAE